MLFLLFYFVRDKYRILRVLEQLVPLVLALAMALIDIWHRSMALHAIEEGVNEPRAKE